MLFAGAATLFVPHAGKIAPKSRYATHATSSATATVTAIPTPIGWVTTAAEFRLPPSAYEHLIDEASERYKFDADLIRAVIRVESAFNPLAVSTAGAQGLMQLMPALAEELGVQNPFDPRENIMAGARYLSYLLDVHKGNISARAGELQRRPEHGRSLQRRAAVRRDAAIRAVDHRASGPRARGLSGLRERRWI